MFNLRTLIPAPSYSRLRQIPQQDAQYIAYLAEVYRRNYDAHQGWAEVATKCIDSTEGRQWDASIKNALNTAKRPAISLNMIGALVRLVLGYFQNNQTQHKYAPGNDERSTDTLAEMLNDVSKNIDNLNKFSFTQSAAFMMGLITGRGFINTTIDFTKNDFGEIRDAYKSPLQVILDADCEDYDISTKAGVIIEEQWLSRHMILAECGRMIYEMLSPYFAGTIPVTGGSVMSPVFPGAETRRGFGQDYAENPSWWQSTLGNLGPLIDPHRRAIKALSFQIRETAYRLQFVDLTTGDKELVPDHFTDDQIRKVMYFAEQNGYPVALKELPYSQVRWSTMIGDKLVYDGKSPYENMTFTGYFPYFREGITRGMVEDLLEPQGEKNKRRSAQIEHLMRVAAGGWIFGDKALTPTQKAHLKRFGSTPGVMVEFQEETKHPPEPIQAATYPQGQEKLEEKADSDFEAISGLNKSALGELDRVQSGRAIEARQRQAVIGIQPYVTNWNLSMALHGEKRLEMIQNFYTEQRLIRVMGKDGRLVQRIINETMLDPAGNALAKMNDITIGKYVLIVDQTPLTANVVNMNFDQTMEMIKEVVPVLGPNAGGALAMVLLEPLLENSSLSDKGNIIMRVQQVLAAMGIPPQGAPMAVPPQPGAAPGQPGMMGHNGGPPMDDPGQPTQGGEAVQQPPSIVTAGSNVIPMPTAGFAKGA